MTEYETQIINTSTELAQFVANVTARVSLVDERSILSLALACKEVLWESPNVQSALQKARHANENIRIVFDLLACSSLTPELLRGLQVLLNPTNSHLLRPKIIFRLMTSLHIRGIADAGGILLPKLHWYSRVELWETAILTFRVCTPLLLRARKLVWIASIRSKRCRILLGILSADGQSPQSASSFLRAVALLANAQNRLHADVVLDLSWISGKEGPALARKVTREMIRVGDYRDCELLIPMLADSTEPTDLQTLSQLAAGPNLAASQLAKALLS